MNPYDAPSDDFNPYDSPPSADHGILADLGQRFLGNLVDNLYYGVVGGIPALVCMVAFDLDVEAVQAVMVLFMIPAACVQWYLVTTSGQSFGKKAMKIKIVKMDGTKVDFISGVVLRSWVLGFVGAFCGMVGLVDVLLIFKADRRCGHDMIAGTKVIQVPFYLPD